MKKTCMVFCCALLMTALALAQPVLVKEIPKGSKNLTRVGNMVFFTSGDSLLKSDGTAAGTVLVKSGLSYPGILREFNGLLYFFNDGNNGENSYAWKELWRSDGTTAGTYFLQRSDTDYIQIVNTAGSNLFFTASKPATGRELYRTNGTVAGTFLLKDIYPGASGGVEVNVTSAVSGSVLYFQAADPAHGLELWKSDGTAAGTVLIKDVNPGAGNGIVGGPFAAGNLIYFSGNDGITGSELWKSDGTSAGTVLVKDITPGIGDTGILFVNALNGNLIFATLDSDVVLYKSNGTAAGTIPLYTWSFLGDYTLRQSVLYNGKLYFFFREGIDIGLYVTDGTAAGTGKVKTVTLDGEVFDINVVNGLLTFTTDTQGFFNSYWKSNGTSAGTVTFYDFVSSDGPRDVTVAGNKIYFADNDGPGNYSTPYNPDDYNQLKVTDLTTTESIRNIYGVSLAGTEEIEYANGKIFFTTYNPLAEASSEQHIKKLWTLSPASLTCTSTGSILREFWSDIPGSAVASIPLTTTPPTSSSQVTLFEGPTNAGNNYGAVYKGFICVPTTGNYTFWIASDDASELWLSTNGNPVNKVLIARVDGWTNSREWDKYASQQSAPIALVAGHRYYIEARHKEAFGNDNLAVGWRLPGGTLERPIPGSRLSPFVNLSPSVSLTNPSDGAVFAAPANITIDAFAYDSDGVITKVEFYSGTTKIGEDNSYPYSYNWTAVPAGHYVLTAKAYDNDGGTQVSAPRYITVTGACTSSGSILREFYDNVTGAAVADIPTGSTPASISYRMLFEGPTNTGDNYGARYRGFICPPATGNYTFWIASDDASELWLSTNSDPMNKALIASVSDWTNPREWTKYPSQQSAPVWLIAGNSYYIEALHKEAYGNDNLAVGWRLPAGTLERPIPGSRLSPYPVPLTSKLNASLYDVSVTNNSISFSLIPNPVSKGRMISISTEGSLAEDGEVLVEIRNAQGLSIHSEKVTAGDLNGVVDIAINNRFTSGMYFVNLIVNGQVHSEKLIIE